MEITQIRVLVKNIEVTADNMDSLIGCLNLLHTKIREAKEKDTSLANGYYPSISGSVLNAYREGDISFEDAVTNIIVNNNKDD